MLTPCAVNDESGIYEKAETCNFLHKLQQYEIHSEELFGISQFIFDSKWYYQQTQLDRPATIQSNEKCESADQ